MTKVLAESDLFLLNYGIKTFWGIRVQDSNHRTCSWITCSIKHTKDFDFAPVILWKLIFCMLYTFQVKAALPPSSSQCPLCHQKHVNPVTTSISGFVFCYKCLWNYIDKFHCCPITYRHCNLEDMIRINLQ